MIQRGRTKNTKKILSLLLIWVIWIAKVFRSWNHNIRIILRFFSNVNQKTKYPAIPKWLKTARKSKGLTQKDLAVKLKISKRSLENSESGVVDVPTATAIAVWEICEYAPGFFDPDGKGQSTKGEVEKGEKVGTNPDTATRYISLLEKIVEKLEKENEELKARMKKSSTKPKAPKKK